jgi:hypothetical protein
LESVQIHQFGQDFALEACLSDNFPR